MEQLDRLVGRERDVDALARDMYHFAGELRAAVVGALHVTCADESERECAEAFQRNISDYLLPNLKFGQRSHMRIANLGGRYEPAAARIANQHYAIDAGGETLQLLLIKINSHVCVESGLHGPRFGRMRRYDTESVYCGALHALLDGATLPFAAELRQAFARDGTDRLATLLDERQVAKEHRSLYVAVANACLQARRALDDVESLPLRSGTLCVIAACVTLNRKLRDTELLCGIYRVDRRSEPPALDYHGLGDDPAGYRLRIELGQLVLDDDRLTAGRVRIPVP